MKKISTVRKAKDPYKIEHLIDNIAAIKSPTGNAGLLDITTNKLVGEIAKINITCDEENKFYFLTATLSLPNKISIYDVSYKYFTVTNWNLITQINNNIFILKSPLNGKIHLLDTKNIRSPQSIFHLSLDTVESIPEHSKYLIITKSSQATLYNIDSPLITKFSFDSIDYINNIFIYYKKNKISFAPKNNPQKITGEFNSLTFDPNNSDIIYCQKDTTTFVYSLKHNSLLLKVQDTEIAFKCNVCRNNYKGILFEIKQAEKLGLISVNKNLAKSVTDFLPAPVPAKAEFSNDIKKEAMEESNSETSVLLNPEYDVIDFDKANSLFYLKKANKLGLLVGDYYGDHLLAPNYDKIKNLGNHFFALYKDNLWNIVTTNSLDSSTEFTKIITNCQALTGDISKGIIYQKNGKKGLVLIKNFQVEKIIPNEYDDITKGAKNYFVLEKNHQKGLMLSGEIIIPVQYDEISFGERAKYSFCFDDMLLSLKKGTNYELVKLETASNLTDMPNLKKLHNVYQKVKFYHQLIEIKDQNHTYIYDNNLDLITTLPLNTSVSEITSKDGTIIYCLDGNYYYCQEGKLIAMFTEESTLYITTYETNNYSFEVQSFDENEHNTFCDFIDSKQELEGEKALIEFSSNIVPKTKYPTLSLKRTKKICNNSSNT